MVKGSYNIAPTSEPDPSLELGLGLSQEDIKTTPKCIQANNRNISGKRDNSYKALVCNLLAFIAICLIIIVISFPYKFRNKNTNPKPIAETENTSLPHGSDAVYQFLTSTNKENLADLPETHGTTTVPHDFLGRTIPTLEETTHRENQNPSRGPGIEETSTNTGEEEQGKNLHIIESYDTTPRPQYIPDRDETPRTTPTHLERNFHNGLSTTEALKDLKGITPPNSFEENDTEAPEDPGTTHRHFEEKPPRTSTIESPKDPKGTTPPNTFEENKTGTPHQELETSGTTPPGVEDPQGTVPPHISEESKSTPHQELETSGTTPPGVEDPRGSIPPHTYEESMSTPHQELENSGTTPGHLKDTSGGTTILPDEETEYIDEIDKRTNAEEPGSTQVPKMGHEIQEYDDGTSGTKEITTTRRSVTKSRTKGGQRKGKRLPLKYVLDSTPIPQEATTEESLFTNSEEPTTTDWSGTITVDEASGIPILITTPGKTPIPQEATTEESLLTNIEELTTTDLSGTITTEESTTLENWSGITDSTDSTTKIEGSGFFNSASSQENTSITPEDGDESEEEEEGSGDVNEEILTENSIGVTEDSSDSFENQPQEEKSISFFGEKKPLSSVHVCQDISCKFISTRILNKINHVIDPCEDFYSYACGNYNQDNKEQDILKRITKEIDRTNEKSPEYLKRFKNYYEKCLEFHENFDYKDRVSKAKDLFYSVSRLYGPEEHLPHEMNTTELIFKLLFLDFTPIFDVGVDIDRGTKNFVFQINLGKQNFEIQNQNCYKKVIKKYSDSQIIELNQFYESYNECQKNLSHYLNNVEKAFEIFDVYPHLNETDRKIELESLQRNIEFEILDSKMPNPGEVRQHILKKKYKIKKLSDLEEIFPFIQWCKLFSKLHGKWIDNRQRIQIYFAEYFEKFLKNLNDMPPLKLHNALMAMFAEKLYTNFIQPKNLMENPSKYCLKGASTLLKRESTSIYLNSWSTNEISENSKALLDIFVALKSNLSSMVESAEWLDSKSRENILKKIDKIEIVTENMLDTLRNDTFMNFPIENLDGNDSYQNQTIEFIKINQKTKFKLWNKSSDNLDYIWWHYMENFYSEPGSIYALGKILVPLHTLLKIPKEVPKYVRLASVDYPIAREIGHQFDPIGITYPLNPEISSILTKESMSTYFEMKNCGNDKYSYQLSMGVDDQNYGFTIDPDLSLEERIAEDIALKLIDHTSAFVENEPLLPFMSNSFSREKTMYLVLTQEHCKKSSVLNIMTGLFESEKLTPAVLVKSFLGNSGKFPQTFQCKEGSGMYPPIKCQQFPDLTPPEYPEYPNVN